jgi:hypothetical protein
MALGQRPTRDAVEQMDLIRSNTFRLAWWAPGVLIIFANVAYHVHWLTFAETGVLMVISAVTFGLACFINGRRCGRTHCVIDGYLLPLLGIVGLINLARVTHIGWQLYMDIFWIIIGLSFVPELLGVKYLPSAARGARGT